MKQVLFTLLSLSALAVSTALGASTTSTTPRLVRTPVSRTSTKVTTTSKATSTFKTTSSTKTSTTSSIAPTTTAANAIVAKKGISFNNLAFTSLYKGAAGWTYDWGQWNSDKVPAGMVYEPMLWGTKYADHTTYWKQSAEAAIAAGATHLLGFNEPDLSSQANMTVAQAVTAWKTYMEPFAGRIKLVSPVVTNGGAPMGVTWLKQFVNSCTGCHIDAVALHWYDAAWNTGYFYNYLTDAINMFPGKKVWLTEFAGSGTAAERATFFKTVVPWLNNNANIERYAAFGLFEGAASQGNFVTNGVLNEVGIAYRDAK